MVIAIYEKAERLSDAEENDILWEVAGDILGPAYRAAYGRLFSLKGDIRVQYTPPFRHTRRAVRVPKAA
jgi:hypothetical protein